MNIKSNFVNCYLAWNIMVVIMIEFDIQGAYQLILFANGHRDLIVFLYWFFYFFEWKSTRFPRKGKVQNTHEPDPEDGEDPSDPDGTPLAVSKKGGRVELFSNVKAINALEPVASEYTHEPDPEEGEDPSDPDGTPLALSNMGGDVELYANVKAMSALEPVVSEYTHEPDPEEGEDPSDPDGQP